MTWAGIMVSTGEVDLWCHDSGRDGPAVVLLHGLAGHAGEWDETAGALASTHRVVAFDQRGHGRSTRQPGDVSRAAYVRDVVAVTTELALGPVTLIGQSMGAHTAMLTAAEHPELVGRLVMVEGGVGGGGRQATDPVASLLRSWPVPFPDEAAAGEYFGGGAVGSVWAAGLEEAEGGLWPRFDVEVMVASLAAVHQRARWQEWERVVAPTLLVTGEKGLIPSAEVQRMLEGKPSATLATVAGAGHDVHLGAPQGWQSVLLEFVAAG